MEAGGPESFEGRVGTASMENGGSFAVHTSASATSAGFSDAEAFIGAAVLQQGEMSGAAALSFTNDGSFAVGSDAHAVGAFGYAGAEALGVNQQIIALQGADATFGNAGTFSVAASADATGTEGAFGSSFAVGYLVEAEPLTMHVSNSGTFTVTSTAESDGFADAFAGGMGLFANIDPTQLPAEEGGGGQGEGGNGGNGGHGGEDEVDDPWEGWTNTLSGTVTNSGTIDVTATALGGDLGGMEMIDARVPQVIEANSYAEAIGLYFDSAVNGSLLTNTGTISATAITDGGISDATAILVETFDYSPVVSEGQVFTIANNGGTLIARESVDGGHTFTHGVAIDTSEAPNPVEIAFSGAGHVYGNIRLSDDDVITVSNGVTVLDGVVNPLEQFNGLDTTYRRPAAAGPVGPLVGSLTVNNGGTLFLANDPLNNPSYSGPAAVNVDAFRVIGSGTLALELPSFTLAGDAEGSYPYVNANTANISGSILEVVLNTPNGLYDDSYFFDDIIDANTLTGTFGLVTTDTGSLFLDLDDIYDGNDNVDLGITRVPFEDPRFDLNPNQESAAEGIEGIYSPTLTGPFADVLAEMFLIDNESEYRSALSSMHAAQYATYMQSLGWMGTRFNGVLNDMGECASLQMQDGTISCRRENPVGIWGTIDYGRENINTDFGQDASGLTGDQFLASLGVDFAVGESGVIGLGGGYVQNKASFDRWAGQIDASGFQVGAYGAYDPGNF